VKPPRGQPPSGGKGDENMTTEAKVPVVAARGGSFLIEERAPDEIFTPEDFSRSR